VLTLRHALYNELRKPTRVEELRVPGHPEFRLERALPSVDVDETLIRTIEDYLREEIPKRVRLGGNSISGS
jgi:hypothetical protein